MDISAKIYEQQAVVGVLAKKTQHECFRAEDSAVYAAWARFGKHGITLAEFYQVSMQVICGRIFLAFGKIQFAARECLFARGIVQHCVRFGGCN